MKDMADKICNVYGEVIKSKSHKISMLCLDVCKHLEKAKIPHIIEMNIDNIFVDIMIP